VYDDDILKTGAETVFDGFKVYTSQLRVVHVLPLNFTTWRHARVLGSLPLKFFDSSHKRRLLNVLSSINNVGVKHSE